MKLSRLVIFGLSVALLTPVVFAQSSAYVPLVVLGNGWTQQIVIQNTGPNGSCGNFCAPSGQLGTISFFSMTGAPLAVNINGIGTVTSFGFPALSRNSTGLHWAALI